MVQPKDGQVIRRNTKYIKERLTLSEDKATADSSKHSEETTATNHNQQEENQKRELRDRTKIVKPKRYR